MESVKRGWSKERRATNFFETKSSLIGFNQRPMENTGHQPWRGDDKKSVPCAKKRFFIHSTERGAVCHALHTPGQLSSQHMLLAVSPVQHNNLRMHQVISGWLEVRNVFVITACSRK